MTYTAITDERTTSLAAIHLSWGLPTGVEILALLNNGITLSALIGIWPVGAATVRFDGPTFEPDPNGARALTFTVIDGGEIIDIAAWQPRSGKLASWRGQAFCLGDLDDLFNPATYFGDGALRIHRTPLEWLKANREGIVIVQPRYAFAYLSQARRIECADTKHAAQLDRWLRPPKRTAKIVCRKDAA